MKIVSRICPHTPDRGKPAFNPRTTRIICALSAFLLWIMPFTVYGAVREPVVAGGFYPGNPAELNAAVDRFLDAAPEQKIPGPLFALIVPHAGYEYSGPAAAYSYKLLKGIEVDTVILIGPSHRLGFDGASIWQTDAWKTPLGEVAVDTDLAKALAAEDPRLSFDANAHVAEHSLEVQLPFLQKVLKNFKIVPIAMGNPTPENARMLARAIYRHLSDKKVLVIVSTDLSHYYPDPVARKMDQKALDLVADGDPGKLEKAIQAREVEMCGDGGVLALLEMAKMRGSAGIQVLKYTNSGDVTGVKEKVVGYGAVAFYETGPAEVFKEGFLDQRQQKSLLKIARDSVTGLVDGNPNADFSVADPELEKKQGAFVTMHVDGDLRGCIGNPLPTEPLNQVVHEKAIDAASRDYRFPAIRKNELDKLDIEISVLTVPRLVKSADEIILGKHGVIVIQGTNSGLFLPQVGSGGWTKEAFLSELCSQKAGLPRDCWNDPRTQLYVFEAQVFSEKEQK